MEEVTEDLRPAVTVSDHETRIAALEKRLNEPETRQLGRSDDNAEGASAHAINVQTRRLYLILG